jgi:hypothetical protein
MLMRRAGLRGIVGNPRRKYLHQLPPASDLVIRQFTRTEAKSTMGYRKRSPQFSEESPTRGRGRSSNPDRAATRSGFGDRGMDGRDK